MILAAAAAVAPMAMADEAECAVATTAYGTELAKQMMPSSECSKEKPTCPTSMQGAIDKIYADCGGLEVAGAEWDTAAAVSIKTYATDCACSGAAAAAPVFALIAAVTAFFA
jgi:hypothetical protein